MPGAALGFQPYRRCEAGTGLKYLWCSLEGLHRFAVGVAGFDLVVDDNAHQVSRVTFISAAWLEPIPQNTASAAIVSASVEVGRMSALLVN
jgi:hypothetical protein